MERFKMQGFFLVLFALILCFLDVTDASYCYYSYYYYSYRCYYYYYYYYYSDSAGVIAGAVIGGLFGLACIIGVIVFVCVVVCKCKTTGVRGRVVQPNVGVSNTVTYISPPTTYNSYGYNGAPPMNASPQMPPAYTNQAPPSYSQPPPPEPQYNEPAYPPNPPPQYNNVISGAPPNSHNYR
ncbi:cysteine and tyrosine-rich protein 1-like isoform X2 [Ostrea edulis]|uniref:cysteine and tyrosine-rich protein 1-like isoform X2 n=1 Tax=Ostrea edulis TaxID=37623 RepID=UPI0024AF3DB3|nr:cysteine and tyrosine-rich protein 1-like isoform X2 [Ostrea edulis]